jgi:copper transport outer membrane protein MctB
MISLRQHVSSLVAVFLALAVGIALGGGLLGGDDDEPDDQSATSSSDAPEPTTTGAASYADAFAAAGAARLYAAGLDGHAVAILSMPGAEPAQIKSLTGQVTAAGGAITGTYVVGDALLEPSQKELVDTQGSQLVTQLADPRLDPAATTYERMGQLIALAMATDQQSSARADTAAVAIRQALATAELLTSPVDVRTAPLVLVVLPPGSEGGSRSLATTTILSGLVNGLGANAAGVVVAGDTESAADGGLAALRSTELVGPISTVDGLDTTIGQVTTVLALASVLSGTGGAYGASGADGPVPLG